MCLWLYVRRSKSEGRPRNESSSGGGACRKRERLAVAAEKPLLATVFRGVGGRERWQSLSSTSGCKNLLFSKDVELISSPLAGPAVLDGRVEQGAAGGRDSGSGASIRRVRGDAIPPFSSLSQFRPFAASPFPLTQAHLTSFSHTRSKDSQGNPKIAVILNSSSSAGPSSQQSPAFPGRRPPPPGSVGSSVPTEYKLTMQNTESKNLFVFGEKIEDVEETGEEGARKKRRTSRALVLSSRAPILIENCLQASPTSSVPLHTSVLSLPTSSAPTLPPRTLVFCENVRRRLPSRSER